MIKKDTSDKYNDSCVKVFNLLSVLSNGTADFADVIQLFKDKNGKFTQKSNVILNKYMNTLKIFGIDIRKNKNKYYLMKMPFSINLDENGLCAVALIKSVLNFFPNGKEKKALENFIEKLQQRYDYSTQKLDNIITKFRNYDLSFYYKKYEKQIADCEKFCQDGQKIEIYYSEADGQNKSIFCTPLELKYQKNQIGLCVYVPLLGQIVDIPISAIKNIVQLPIKATKSKMCTTVIFKLKGDLAKRYKLREQEYTNGIDNDGWLVVVNSGEDFQSLSKRLFKYDKDCVVVSPKYLRENLIKMVDKTLKNYQ